MNLYDRWILPRLLDLVMRNMEATRFRAQLVPQARGAVLEVGIGSGLNLPFYGEQVGWLESLKAMTGIQKAFELAGGVASILSGLYLLNAYFFLIPKLAA